MIRALALFALAATLAACGASPEQVPDAERPSLDDEAIVVAEGSFTPKVHQVTGTARIEEADGARRLLFLDDFSVDNGPALVVVLSPTPEAALTRDNALAGSTVLGDLAAVRGAQAYALPDDLDVEGFASVHVWCEAFGVLFAAADLAPAE